MRSLWSADEPVAEIACVVQYESKPLAEVTLGDSIVQLSDAIGKWKPVQVPLLVYVTDTDSTYRRALKAGATSLRGPMDTFYGDRSAGVEDSFDNSWWIVTHQEDVSREELERRAERKK